MQLKLKSVVAAKMKSKEAGTVQVKIKFPFHIRRTPVVLPYCNYGRHF